MYTIADARPQVSLLTNHSFSKTVNGEIEIERVPMYT